MTKRLRKGIGIFSIAGGAFVSLLLMLAVGYNMGLAGGYYSAQKDGYSIQIEQDTRRQIDGCFAQPQSITATRECVERAVAASRDSQRAEDNLDAQRQMADWTKWLTWLTLGQIPLTAIGLLLLLNTLWDGRAALKHSEDTAETELRPWLQVEISVRGYHRTAQAIIVAFDAVVKNIGKTPALRVSLARKLLTHSEGIYGRVAAFYRQETFNFVGPARTILPSGQTSFDTAAGIEHAEVTGYDASEGRKYVNPIVALVVVYEGPSGVTRKTGVAFSVRKVIKKTIPAPGEDDFYLASFSVEEKSLPAIALRAEEFGLNEIQ